MVLGSSPSGRTFLAAFTSPIMRDYQGDKMLKRIAQKREDRQMEETKRLLRNDLELEALCAYRDQIVLEEDINDDAILTILMTLNEMIDEVASR